MVVGLHVTPLSLSTSVRPGFCGVPQIRTWTGIEIDSQRTQAQHRARGVEGYRCHPWIHLQEHLVPEGRAEGGLVPRCESPVPHLMSPSRR